MAKKLSRPVKKSSAKLHAKGARKLMASGCAGPASKRGAKAAYGARRPTGTLAFRRTHKGLAKAKASKPVANRALAKVPAKPLPKASIKGAARPQAPSGKAPRPALGQASKPVSGEIAARLLAQRTEKALARGKARSGKKGVELRRVELTPAEAEARKMRLKNLIVLGKERRYLTYAEINDQLPDDILDAEQIKGIISMINDLGIQV